MRACSLDATADTKTFASISQQGLVVMSWFISDAIKVSIAVIMAVLSFGLSLFKTTKLKTNMLRLTCFISCLLTIFLTGIHCDFLVCYHWKVHAYLVSVFQGCLICSIYLLTFLITRAAYTTSRLTTKSPPWILRLNLTLAVVSMLCCLCSAIMVTVTDNGNWVLLRLGMLLVATMYATGLIVTRMSMLRNFLIEQNKRSERISHSSGATSPNTASSYRRSYSYSSIFGFKFGCKFASKFEPENGGVGVAPAIGRCSIG
uniref:Uncharacterized protein n=1 Tax=Lotharella oceanica TaxID=641309 RepID=A0A7S2TEP6_9EUKA